MHAIDILLATYNGEKYLPELLDSLSRQSFSDWKIIARDDCSKDNTIKILEEYQQKNPGKIEIIKGDNNLGAKGSFSYLMGVSCASYIMFCDQDDVWKESKIEKFITEIKKQEKNHGVDTPILIHSDLTVVDSALNVISPSFKKYQRLDMSRNSLNQLLVQNTITGCAVIINRRLKEMAFPVPLEARMHDHWLGLVASIAGVVAYIDECLVLYRQHQNNTVGASGESLIGVLKKSRKISRIKEVLAENFVQAEAVLNKCKETITLEKKQMLSDFISIKKAGWFGKRATLIKHKFYRSSLIDNLGLFLFV